MVVLTKRQRNLVILSLLLATIAEASSLLYPQVYVPKLIRYFGYPQEEVGYYVGMLNSARYIGNIAGALIWSSLSDIKGRRTVILINLSCSVVVNLMFAFASSLPVAIATRLLAGATSGVTPLCKTVAYEVSDSSNQVTAMSFVNFGFTSGVLVAVNMGAFLSDPYNQFGDMWPELWLVRKFPFVLPGLVFCSYCCLVLLVCYCCLAETLDKEQGQCLGEGEGEAMVTSEECKIVTDEECKIVTDEECKIVTDEECKAGEECKSATGCKLHKSQQNLALQRIGASSSELRRCRSQLLAPAACKSSLSASNFGLVAELAGSVATLSPPQLRSPARKRRSTSGCSERVRHFLTSRLHIFTNYPCFWRVLLAYTITASATIMFDECVSVFALDSASGLSLQSKHLGFINIIAMLCLLPFIVLLPILNARLGPMRMHLFGLSLGLVAILSFPLSVLFGCPHRLATCIGGLGCLLGIKNICLFYCFTTISVLLNNSIPPAKAGTANGIGVVCSNFSRILGITIGTSLLQFLLNREMHYPLDHNLVFLLVGMLLCTDAVIQKSLPLSIEYQVHKL